MKCKRLLALLLTLTVLLAGAFSLLARADFGDFAGDYDFGGGDYGGYDSDDDYDYGGGGYYYGGSSSGSSSGSGGVVGAVIVWLIIIFIIVFAVVKNKKSGGPGTVVRGAGGQATPMNLLQPIGNYTRLDPGFSEAAMREKISNLYVQFQNAWHNKDLSPLRPYMTDAYYAQSDAQLEHYRRDRQTSYLERIAVLGVQLSGFTQQNGNDVMVARINARFVNYVLDDNTGALVRGSRTAEKFMEYEWRLERTSGRVTGREGGMTVHNCPNCGAPLNINRTAKCEYCGSIVQVDSFDWVVSGITALSQRTVGR